MNYLADSEYESYGMEPATAGSMVAAASTLINTYLPAPNLRGSAVHRAHPDRARAQQSSAHVPAAGHCTGSKLAAGLRKGPVRHATPRRRYHAVGHDVPDCHRLPTAGDLGHCRCEHL